MNLVIDIGNTRCKVGVFEKGVLQNHFVCQKAELFDVVKSQNPTRILLSSVVDMEQSAIGAFKQIAPTQVFSLELKLPITYNYQTPRTLGVDRLAAAIGGMTLKPNQNSLIVDLGTCMTLDFVSADGIYHGGAISPGLAMRFKSMHENTSALPFIQDVEKPFTKELPGSSTNSCLELGVLKGIQYEIEGHWRYYKEKYGVVQLILTGGDASYFENTFNTPIFVNDLLVLMGLNRVLEENEI
jgi:type III pantothenate kinase